MMTADSENVTAGVDDRAAAESTDVDTVVADVDAFCRITKPFEIRRFTGRRLGRMATDLGVCPEQLIDRAIDELEHDAYAAAARALFGDPTTRSANLMNRTRRAADAFGVSFETFRKRRDGRSPRDEVLIELSHAVVSTYQRDCVPRVQPVGNTADQPHPMSVATVHPSAHGRETTSGREPPSPRRRKVGAVMVALVAIASLAATVGWSSWRRVGDDPQMADDATIALSGEIDVSLHCTTSYGQGWDAVVSDDPSIGWHCRSPDRTVAEVADLDEACVDQYGPSAAAANRRRLPESWRCEIFIHGDLLSSGCRVGPGAFDPALDFEFQRFASEFHDLYHATGGRDAVGCPTTSMHRWSDGVVQELAMEGEASGALLGSATTDVVLLDRPTWQAFDRIKSVPGGLVGFPAGEAVDSGGHWLINLSGGGALVAASEPGPYFWIPPVLFQYWEASGSVEGCWGLPLGDPHVEGEFFGQSFTGGDVVFDPVDGEIRHAGESC